MTPQSNSPTFWRDLMIELSAIDYGSEIPKLDDHFLSVWADHYFRIGRMALQSHAIHDTSVQPQGDLLEIGTGFGILATGMARLTGSPVMTVEHPSRAYFSAPVYTDFLKKNRIILVGCDLRWGLPFRSNTFHTLLICDVMEHLHFQDLRTLFDEAKRLLAPGGRIIISTPNLSRLGNLIRVLFGYGPNPPIYPEVCGETFGHIREFAPKELRAFITRHGFSITHLEYGRNPFFTSEAFGADTLFSPSQTAWINRINRWMAPVFPSLGDEIYLEAINLTQPAPQCCCLKVFSAPLGRGTARRALHSRPAMALKSTALPQPPLHEWRGGRRVR